MASVYPDPDAPFPGFDPPRYTPTPDDYYDRVMPFLGLAEARVLQYIIRHTFGYRKAADAISIDQFMHGIETRDGRRVDYGTQLSRSAVLGALRALRERGYIDATLQEDERGSKPTRYQLRLREGGAPPWTPEDADVDEGGPPARMEGVRRRGPTRNKGQETIRQEDTRTSKYTRGRYAPCPVCGARPCADDCPRAAG